MFFFQSGIEKVFKYVIFPCLVAKSTFLIYQNISLIFNKTGVPNVNCETDFRHPEDLAMILSGSSKILPRYRNIFRIFPESDNFSDGIQILSSYPSRNQDFDLMNPMESKILQKNRRHAKIFPCCIRLLPSCLKASSKFWRQF